jgi:hypothetical protein
VVFDMNYDPNKGKPPTSSDDVSDDQRKRNESGTALELSTFYNLKKESELKLEEYHMSLLYGKTLKSERPDIWGRMEFYTPGGSFVGDIDIVLYHEYEHKPILIISTKTSLRERLYQVLCTYFMYKEKYPGILVWFVTDDVGRGKNKRWQSELGSEIKPTKPRMLGNRYNIPIFSSNTNTSYGGCVKPISQLSKDIIRVFCK